MKQIGTPKMEIVIAGIEAFLVDDERNYDIIDLNNSGHSAPSQAIRLLLLVKALSSLQKRGSFIARGWDLVFSAPPRFKDALSALEQVKMKEEDVEKAARLDFDALVDMICSKVLVGGGGGTA